MNPPRIAIPEPSAQNPAYSQENWPRYARAVEAAGGEPVFIPLGASPDEIARTLATCNAVLLPGCRSDLNPEKYEESPHGSNPADSAREAVDELLLQDAFNLGKPILAICYGFQSMNVWLGGSLLQDLPVPPPPRVVHSRVNGELPPLHPVEIAEGSRLGAIVGLRELRVNSSHHQAVARLGDALDRVAVSPSDGVVEAAEMRGPRFVLGVQWHPERSFDEDAPSRRIFEALAQAAREWTPVPSTVSGS